jgi:hypothetical protein
MPEKKNVVELQAKTFSVEKKMNGFHSTIHKSGSEVRIFSEQKKDLTSAFPTLIEAIKKLSGTDFIIDGELVPYDSKGNTLGRNELMKYTGAVKSGKKPDDSNIKLHVWDITYLGKPTYDLPLSERIKLLGKLKFNDRVLEIERKIVTGEGLEPAIKWACDLKGSEGTVVKDISKPYSFGEDPSWKKFRRLTPLVVHVIKVVPKKRDLFNYLVGVKADKKNLDSHYIDNGYLVLGHTFNTDKKFSEGDNIEILVEEIWRHELKSGIHYSIHKPRVVDKTSDALSTVDKLEDVVTSIGVSIMHEFIEGNEVLILKEPASETLPGEPTGEGKEVMIKNFSNRMQSDFRKMIGKWGRYVMQVHTRGKTLHYDLRHKVQGDVLEGITLFGRSIPDRLPIETQRNNIRSTIKLPQPIDWLTFEGITHKGGIGATTNNPGVFTIISRGLYTIHEVEDHKIIIEYKSGIGPISSKTNQRAKKEGFFYPTDLPKEMIKLDGTYSWHIAHIGDKHIILFDKLKNYP